MPLLDVRNVSFAFGGVKALDGISLTVNEGEIVSIIGPNGAGKTTLFNVISGLLQPQHGEVALDGHVSRAAAASHRAAGIGRTNQIVRPFGRLSVVDNVAVGALVARTRRCAAPAKPRARSSRSSDSARSPAATPAR